MPPNTRFGNKFIIYPKEGSLQPGESEALVIRFESDVLGEFNEFFRFALQGNEHMMECNIKGHVIGPTFHFDAIKIDYGLVSFDYLHSHSVRLVNTSSIPVVFNLHVPQDGTHNKKEFDIMPATGTLLSGDYIEVVVEFIPGSAKIYDYVLSVDVLGVGDMLLNIPIAAECVVSEWREIWKYDDMNMYLYRHLFINM
jgi:hydrocephalus-inducing protein